MTGYAVETAALNDVALINLRCSVDVAKSIEATCGLTFPDTGFASWSNGSVITARLAPDQWWLRAHINDEDQLVETMKAASKDSFCAVTAITDHFQGFGIKGKQLNAVLSQAMSIDLRALDAGTVTRGKFARAGATVFVTDPANEVDVFVEASYADYIDAWLNRAIGADL